MANEIVVEDKKQSFGEVLSVSLDQHSQAFPISFNKERCVQNAVAFLNDNEQLRNYAKQYGTRQIMLGIIKSAILDVSPMNKECYLIPYGSQLNFMLDYRGAVKVAKKYSIRPIKDIYAKVVREGDEFHEEVVDGEERFEFKPIPFSDAPIVGAFAVCIFQDGGVLVDTMTKKQLDMTRSKARTKNVWNDFEEEMVRKTVLHRISKRIQLDFDNPEQLKTFNEDGGADFAESPAPKASVNALLEEDA